MRSKASHQNKFLRIITIPIRALCKARDLYVKSMVNYAERMNYGNMAVPGASQVPGLPRSFSATSSRSYDNEDFRELVRASSARHIGARVDVDSYVRQQMMVKGSGGGPRAMPPRSSSVVMGRIDEERPCCYFGEDNGDSSGVEINGRSRKFPRSKSHAVTRKTGF